ncbi:beta strand repeat-containing protein [Methanobrevibacter sp.]|uniref:beta strand repeat-containing protein n=1 Tax=Methanobrevibacter sp. TaxID=66852 RepID=UPI00389052C3
MNKKLILLLMIALVSITSISFVSAANETSIDDGTTSESQIIANDLVKYYGNDNQLTCNVIDNDTNPIENVSVKFNINGKNYSRITNSSGIAKMNINLNSGNYTYYAYYLVNNTLISQDTGLIQILSTVSGDNLVKIYRNDTQYYATFLDTNGDLLADTNITFNINGVMYTRKTNSSGVAKLNINLNPGKYIITATNSNGQMYSNNITVLNSISGQDIIKYYRNGTQYYATFLDCDGSVLNNTNVTFNINGVFYTRKTNENGTAKLNINLNPGTYILTASNPKTTELYSNTITVLSYLSAQDLSMSYKDGSKFNATLLDSQGNLLAGENITFNINGVFYTRTTNSQGVASLNINLLPGNYIITSSYNGLNIANTIKIQSVETSDPITVSGQTSSLANTNYATSTSDKSVVTVTNKGSLTLDNTIITKSGGDTSNTESSDFYGLNAAVLVNSASFLNLTNAEIITNAKGANAVFVTGSSSTAYVENVTITTSKDSSRGLDATYSGTIIAHNVTINTSGQHCAATATDRGEGTLYVYDSVLNTNGLGSPSIYSTGNINVYDSTGSATASSIAVIEGKNSITIDGCNFNSYAYGRTTKGIDCCAVMIYQSMSGDASVGLGSFTSKNSVLTVNPASSVYKTAPFFFITNTDANIYLENTTINYGSGILINVSGNTGEWGKSGSNGGDLTFTAVNEVLTGNIYVDKISTIILSLTSSALTSAINTANTASSVSLSLSSDSTWSLTGNSYLTTFTDSDTSLSNIQSNGYNIYYKSSANSWLNGATITLNGGGKLIPY